MNTASNKPRAVAVALGESSIVFPLAPGFRDRFMPMSGDDVFSRALGR